MKKNPFFDSRNTIDSISDAEVKDLYNYLDPIRALARTSYISIFVIDYLTQGFEYVSENPLFLCGNTAEEVLKMGYSFYLNHVPEKDFELLLKINDAGFNLYEKIPLSERLEYTISYDFHLKNKEGKTIMVNKKVTPIFLNTDGKILKAVSVMSLSSEKEVGNIKVFKSNENKIYKYNLESQKWIESEKVILNKREIEILQFSIRGFTINEIAEAVFLSPDTIKFHRRKLFEKLEVTNISEAIIYATNNKLI